MCEIDLEKEKSLVRHENLAFFTAFCPGGAAHASYRTSQPESEKGCQWAMSHRTFSGCAIGGWGLPDALTSWGPELWFRLPFGGPKHC